MHISFDFKQVVFLNNEENFIIKDLGKFRIKQNLHHLQGRIIKFVKSFQEEPGIYFVTCDKYGKDLYIQCSEAEDINIKIQSDIESKYQKIYDFEFLFKPHEVPNIKHK